MPQNTKSNLPSPRNMGNARLLFCSFSHFQVEGWNKVVLLVVTKNYCDNYLCPIACEA